MHSSGRIIPKLVWAEITNAISGVARFPAPPPNPTFDKLRRNTLDPANIMNISHTYRFGIEVQGIILYLNIVLHLGEVAT